MNHKLEGLKKAKEELEQKVRHRAASLDVAEKKAADCAEKLSASQAEAQAKSHRNEELLERVRTITGKLQKSEEALSAQEEIHKQREAAAMERQEPERERQTPHSPTPTQPDWDSDESWADLQKTVRALTKGDKAEREKMIDEFWSAYYFRNPANVLQWIRERRKHTSAPVIRTNTDETLSPSERQQRI